MSTKRHLTFATAQKIREYRAETNRSPRKIIDDLGLLNTSVSAVHAIITNRTYKTRKQNVITRSKLSSKQVREIKGQLGLGIKPEYLALKYGVRCVAIERIKYGLTWTKVYDDNDN